MQSLVSQKVKKSPLEQIEEQDINDSSARTLFIDKDDEDGNIFNNVELPTQ